MSIATEISRIQSAKASIKEAIEAKGVTVPQDAKLDAYPTYVGQIEQGGGGGSVPANLESVEYDDWGHIVTATTKQGLDIPYGVFSGNDYLEEAVIGDGCTSVGDVVFSGCTNLSAVTIPSSVDEIGQNCFSYCKALTEVAIPEAVTQINNSCFSHCISLHSITVPSGVTYIGNYVFEGCSNLQSVTIKAETPPTLMTQVFTNTNNCPIYVPCGCAEAYKSASGWSSYADRIQEMPSCSSGDTGPIVLSSMPTATTSYVARNYVPQSRAFLSTVDGVTEQPYANDVTVDGNVWTTSGSSSELLLPYSLDMVGHGAKYTVIIAVGEKPAQDGKTSVLHLHIPNMDFLNQEGDYYVALVSSGDTYSFYFTNDFQSILSGTVYKTTDYEWGTKQMFAIEVLYGSVSSGGMGIAFNLPDMYGNLIAQYTEMVPSTFNDFFSGMGGALNSDSSLPIILYSVLDHEITTEEYNQIKSELQEKGVID